MQYDNLDEYIDLMECDLREQYFGSSMYAENFYRIQPESIAPLFSYLNEDIDKFYKVFWEVERQMGVKNEFSSSFVVMKMIQDYNRKEEVFYRNPDKLEKVR